MMKYIIVPVAAFVVTATAASAFNPDLLDQIDVELSDSQIEALEEAAELREDGADRDEIKTVLEAAGIDEDLRKEIKTAVKEVRKETRSAIRDAIDNADFTAFTAVAAGTPLEVIDTEAEFERLLEAHELKEAGDRDGAREIIADLGIERPEHKLGVPGERGERGSRGGDDS